MSVTSVKTKYGKTFDGPIWKWRPESNWFSIIWHNREKVLSFDDIESAITISDRINSEEIGDRDELERAREDLRNGRKFNWKGFPSEKFNWE